MELGGASGTFREVMGCALWFLSCRAHRLDGERERRRWPRLELKLNVEFAVRDDQSEAGGQGVTENVSAGGMYFVTPDWQALQVGDDVALRLSGLSSYNEGALFRSLHGQGMILRLDPPEEKREREEAGVAVEFEEGPRVELYRASA